METSIEKFNGINLDPIEKIKINGRERITVAEKTKLDKILEKTIDSTQAFLLTLKSEIESTIMDKEKEKCGWKNLKKQVHKAQARVDQLDNAFSELPFDSYGGLRHSHSGNSLELEKELERIRKKKESAVAVIIQQQNWLTKVRAKLMLCSTKREALIIMNSILGNGDNILLGIKEEGS